MTHDEIEEEVERRVQSSLVESGEDPFSDSDHAMYLRQDYRNEIRAEERDRLSHNEDP